MNDIAFAHVLLATEIRRLIAAIRETRQRVLTTEVFRAIEAPKDDEAVHDFRVALRRCRTVLRVARGIWYSKKIIRIERELGYFARTTGKLRDDEVLRTTLASLPPSDAPLDEISEWLERRASVERSNRRTILRIVREGPRRREAKSKKGKPIRALDLVLDKLERLLDTEPTTSLSAQDLAIQSVERAIRDIRHAGLVHVHDTPGMHTLRIREKRLRYTVELFANELGEVGRQLVTHATRMQRRLGDLHDYDEAIATVGRARGLAKDTQRKIIATLRVSRAACAAKAEPHLIEARELALPLVLSCSDSPPNSVT